MAAGDCKTSSREQHQTAGRTHRTVHVYRKPGDFPGAAGANHGTADVSRIIGAPASARLLSHCPVVGRAVFDLMGTGGKFASTGRV